VTAISGESNIHEDEPNPAFLAPDVGRYWMVYEFASDEAAKNAWETIQKRTQFLSAWRAREPRLPPHKHFTVMTIGEDREQMEHAERICGMFNGTPREPEEGLIDSLRHRRIDQATESLQLGTFGRKHTIRSQHGWVMDSKGRRHPNT
jgi:hypothetical protein